MRNEYMYIHVWNNSSHQQSETQLSYLRLPVAMSWHATYLINMSYSPSLLVLDITLPLKSSGFTNHRPPLSPAQFLIQYQIESSQQLWYQLADL